MPSLKKGIQNIREKLEGGYAVRRDLKVLRKNYSKIPFTERVGILALATLAPHNWTAFRKRVKNSLMFHSTNFQKAGV